MTHYNEKYFSWHRSIGEFGGWANLIKFEEYIKSHHRVLDFGSGGGYLLNNINCKEKQGIEINSSAIKEAQKINIKTSKSLKNIRNDWADVIISNHTLEHINNPLETIQILHKKLKKGGKIIFVVPCERELKDYSSNNINQHIYTWNPVLLGNLFSMAGFKIIEAKPFFHKWPNYYQFYFKLFGKRLFHLICFLNGYIDRRIVQVRIVAKK